MSTKLSTVDSVIALHEAVEWSAVLLTSTRLSQDSRSRPNGQCCGPRGTTSLVCARSASTHGESVFPTSPTKTTLAIPSYECGKWTIQSPSHADIACGPGGHRQSVRRAEIGSESAVSGFRLLPPLPSRPVDLTILVAVAALRHPHQNHANCGAPTRHESRTNTSEHPTSRAASGHAMADQHATHKCSAGTQVANFY